MRALSEAQASQCENAKCKGCKCRCHGAFHGAARTPIEGSGPIRAWFEALPEDDPHYLPVRCVRCKRRKAVHRVETATGTRRLCAQCFRREVRTLDADALAALLGAPAPEPEPVFYVGPLRFRAPALWEGEGA